MSKQISNTPNTNHLPTDNSMVFYTNPHSRGNTVHWMLLESEANFQLQLLQFNSDTKSDNYLAINPLGKVPALSHRGHVITETGAICAYLAEIFPSKALKPSVYSPYLCDYYRWIFFLTGVFDAAIIAKITNSLPRDKAVGMSSIGRWEDVEAVIHQGINSAKPYLCGEQFTAADILFTSYLLFATNMLNVIEMTRKIEEYLTPIMARPQFQEMLAFTEIHKSNFKSYQEA